VGQDAPLGYSQSEPPAGRTAELLAATAGRRVAPLDVPSGVEFTSGRTHEPTSVLMRR
jgi:NAD(P)H-hydrate repair Nnr-like enzyme with NAD(P)H-hydrate epimerase domain